MALYDKIKSYYIDGYGYPTKYYTDANLDNFVKNGLITQEQAEEIRQEKERLNEKEI